MIRENKRGIDKFGLGLTPVFDLSNSCQYDEEEGKEKEIQTEFWRSFDLNTHLSGIVLKY